MVDTEPCEFPKWNDATPLADGLAWELRFFDPVVLPELELRQLMSTPLLATMQAIVLQPAPFSPMR